MCEALFLTKNNMNYECCSISADQVAEGLGSRASWQMEQWADTVETDSVSGSLTDLLHSLCNNDYNNCFCNILQDLMWDADTYISKQIECIYVICMFSKS